MVNMYQHEQVVESLYTTIAMLIALKIAIRMKKVWITQWKRHFKERKWKNQRAEKHQKIENQFF